MTIRDTDPDWRINTRRQALVYWLIVAAVFGFMFLWLASLPLGAGWGDDFYLTEMQHPLP